MNNFIMKNPGLLLFPLAFALGGLASCVSTTTYPTPGHCYNEDGDARCAELDPDGDARYCSGCGDDPVGCVADIPSDECYSPCGGRMNVLEDASCVEDPTETMDTETSETMGTETETGPEPCVDNQDCMEPGAPFCDDLSGECVACDGVMDPDAACAEFDPLAPLCSEGACVQCTIDDDLACGDLTPICDADANTCIGCSEHEQCPDSACNIAEGNCFDPENVVHVDGDNPCVDGAGTEEEPYCSLQQTFENVGANLVVILHERDGDASYQESTLVSGELAIFAHQGEAPRLQGFNMSSALTIGPGGVLFLRGVDITNTTDAPGIQVNGGGAWLDECTVSDNDLGMSLTGGTATVRRSRIVNNSGGGIVVDGGGSLVLENSFVGGDVSDVDAVLVIDGSAQINYSTLAGGGDFGETASALTCEPGSVISIRNSVIVAASAGPELVCDDATVTSSALEGMVGDNVVLGDLDPGWFADYLSGDFSLSDVHPPLIDTAATWLDGDPATDINGDARPTTDGASDFAGADRIP